MAILKWIALVATVINLARTQQYSQQDSSQTQQFQQQIQSDDPESRYFQNGGAAYNDQLVQEQDYTISFDYHGHEEMTKFLRLTTAKFPNLSALYSIGKSVQGKFQPIDYILYLIVFQ